jgi:uncharacterized protein YbjT (DUF2867 family)
MAPVDSDDFAGFVAECVEAGARGRQREFAGPQTLTVTEMVEDYLRAHGLDRRIHRAPIPRSIQDALTAGNTSDSACLGTTTWREWLTRSVASGG